MNSNSNAARKLPEVPKTEEERERLAEAARAQIAGILARHEKEANAAQAGADTKAQNPLAQASEEELDDVFAGLG